MPCFLRHPLIALLAILLVPKLLADSWIYPEGPKVVHSTDGSHRFTYTPAKRHTVRVPAHTVPNTASNTATAAASPGETPESLKCLGHLERLEGPQFTTVWRAPLVNPVNPLNALVSNDGTRVITFDTWFGVGKDPIVIYGPRGELIRRHTLESLDLNRFTEWGSDGHEGALIDQSVSSIYWNSSAEMILDDSSGILVIRLHWGHFLGIRLSDGSLLKEEQLPAALRHKTTEAARAKVLRKINSESPHERSAGARQAGLCHFEEFIPRLEELLKDDSFITYTRSTWVNNNPKPVDSHVRAFEVRKAAFRALRTLGRSPAPIVEEEQIKDAPLDRKGQPSLAP